MSWKRSKYFRSWHHYYKSLIKRRQISLAKKIGSSGIHIMYPTIADFDSKAQLKVLHINLSRRAQEANLGPNTAAAFFSKNKHIQENWLSKDFRIEVWVEENSYRRSPYEEFFYYKYNEFKRNLGFYEFEEVE